MRATGFNFGPGQEQGPKFTKYIVNIFARSVHGTGYLHKSSAAQTRHSRIPTARPISSHPHLKTIRIQFENGKCIRYYKLKSASLSLILIRDKGPGTRWNLFEIFWRQKYFRNLFLVYHLRRKVLKRFWKSFFTPKNFQVSNQTGLKETRKFFLKANYEWKFS